MGLGVLGEYVGCVIRDRDCCGFRCDNQIIHLWWEEFHDHRVVTNRKWMEVEADTRTVLVILSQHELDIISLLIHLMRGIGEVANTQNTDVVFTRCLSLLSFRALVTRR